MRVIIAGSRGITDRSDVEQAIYNAEDQYNFEFSEDVEVLQSGTANGVDQLGEEIAGDKGVDIDRYDPEDYHDEAPNPKVAPLLRNSAMAKDGDMLIAVWDGESTGTKDMIDKAESEGLDVYVELVEEQQSLMDF